MSKRSFHELFTQLPPFCWGQYNWSLCPPLGEKNTGWWCEPEEEINSGERRVPSGPETGEKMTNLCSVVFNGIPRPTKAEQRYWLVKFFSKHCTAPATKVQFEEEEYSSVYSNLCTVVKKVSWLSKQLWSYNDYAVFKERHTLQRRCSYVDKRYILEIIAGYEQEQ